VSPEPAASEVDTEPDRRLWPLTLLAGLLPVLLTGFLVSVIANRLVFLGWALLAAVAYFLVLRRGFVWVWHPWRHLGAVLLVLGAVVALLGYLVGQHHQAFDEGMRALFYDIYQPWMTTPGSAYMASLALAVAGGASLALGIWREARRPVVEAAGETGLQQE
jgi:energy-coupling factor transporter transmembrane protein EcfT